MKSNKKSSLIKGIITIILGLALMTALFALPTYAVEKQKDKQPSPVVMQAQAQMKPIIEDEGKTYALITYDEGTAHCLATSRDSRHAERLEEINKDYFDSLEVVEIDKPIEEVKLADIETLFATGE